MHTGLRSEPAIGKVALYMDRRALDPGHIARRYLQHVDGELMFLGPAHIHPKQHLGPVLRLGSAGTGLNIDIGIVLIELAREHAAKFEFRNGLLGNLEIADDISEKLLVVLARSELEQFRRIVQRSFERRDRLDDIGQRCPLPAESLGALRIRPDGGIFQLALDLLEPFTLDIVVKDTPLAR